MPTCTPAALLPTGQKEPTGPKEQCKFLPERGTSGVIPLPDHTRTVPEAALPLGIHFLIPETETR